MQLTQTFVAALLAASTAVAAPTPAADASARAVDPDWTIKNFTRTCGDGDSWCAYEFSVVTQTAGATACRIPVHGTDASHRAGGPVNCGTYKVTSSWSGQFGEGNGFTTLAVVDNKQNLIVYPAYTDKQLVSGKTVTPDQKYSPQALPKF